MGCGCKNALKLQEQGVEEEESLFEKTRRRAVKVIILLLALPLSIITVPAVIIYLVYNQMFGDGKGIVIPTKLSKYIK